MHNQTIFKRLLPFIAALLAGLFVTALFIDITPNFNKYRVNKKRHHERHRMKKLRYENWRLKREKQRLEEQLEAKDKILLLDEAVPAPKLLKVPAETVPADSGNY